jgi:hypothetical protein
VAYTNGQTGLASGSAFARAHQEPALGVYGLVGPTPPQVALHGPCGAFPVVDKWHVAIMLTYPWWSLEGSCLQAGRIGDSLKKEVLVVTPQWGGFEFNASQAIQLNTRTFYRERCCQDVAHIQVRVNRVCLVWSGVSIVHTKRSGALLSAHFACALLVHFVNFATCALPKCASRAQNPTFVPYLGTLFSALESYLSLL